MANVQGKGDEAGKLLKKLIKQLLKKDASKLQGTKPLRDVVAKLPYSKGPSSEIQRAMKKAKRVPRKVEPIKPSEVKSVGSMGGVTTKGPKGKPERVKAPSLKDRRLAKTPAEQRQAEKSANFYLRRDGKVTPSKPPVRDARTGVSEQHPVVPKRSKSRPLGRSWEHEADMMRRQQAADAKNMGRGQRPRGGKPKTEPKPIKPKPAPKPKGPKK